MFICSTLSEFSVLSYYCRALQTRDRPSTTFKHRSKLISFYHLSQLVLRKALIVKHSPLVFLKKNKMYNTKCKRTMHKCSIDR